LKKRQKKIYITCTYLCTIFKKKGKEKEKGPATNKQTEEKNPCIIIIKKKKKSPVINISKRKRKETPKR
jgi:hypothetical protein